MSFRVERSWAEEPLFYRAPYPEQVKPYDFQLAGVEYRLSVPNGRHGLIGDEPGLGKTCEGTLVSNALGAKQTLVTCPASLLYNWQREVWRWSTIENVHTHVIDTSKRGTNPYADYTILSFDMIKNDQILDGLLDMRFDHWIIDEAHALKDPKGNQRTKVMCAPDLLPSVVGHITLMSGTFLPNQPIELYNVMRLCDHEALDYMSVDAFREYFYEKGSGWVTKYDPKTRTYKPTYSTEVRNQPRRLDELQNILRDRLMVRRLKKDLLSQLPDKQWHPFPLRASADINRLMRNDEWVRVEELYEMDPDAFDINAPIDGMVSTLLRELGEVKAPKVADYIEDLLMEVDKVIVAAWHHSVLDVLRKRLEKYGLVYMDGRTSISKKQAAVDQFQNRDDVRVILGQMKPLGEGWTLTRASDVVFAEFFWTPGKNDQMLDRVHRLGQTHDYVLGHLPIVPDSIDERVVARAITKAQHAYLALDHRH